MASQRKAYRASILHCIADPKDVGLDNCYEFFEDGLIVIEDGYIVDIGESNKLMKTLSKKIPIQEYENKLITSGFIDTHIHYPQIGIIASYGEQLLDWLENYTFPEEMRFSDPQYARSMANLFFQQLMSNGTTTALVFGTVHKQSVDIFFEEAHKRRLRMIAGKVLMDQNAPPELTDTPESAYQDSKALIEKWHNKDRLLYAVTPRFAPTSSPQQLKMAGKLLKEFPDVYMHTHLSENLKEIDWVKALFPERAGYLDVYDHYGLLHKRSVFAHGIHLSDHECQRLAQTHSSVAFCPTSNLFLGSGLFNLSKLENYQVRVGMGTDVGAGTSFSLLQTMNEAYKIMQLQQEKLHPLKSLYLATLGGAKALHLEDKIGNLQVGKEADFVVLDLHATSLFAMRMKQAKTLEERLFVLMMLGDERNIHQTYIMGEKAFQTGSIDKQ
ncbi:guanine deaminase [Vibrio sp. OCN044]|uniref:Guanine deaminase n=1 Tax=Vibrio tetraodonis subsp. pristinus TaxID=2695891 RepID=A0A6L8LT30_9VIBR|nr:guanine deaminase [Vibrio tetraodonis]MYM59264.1 guanine deaminase [Vibrio tetraodonis subsp. pristinus]